MREVNDVLADNNLALDNFGSIIQQPAGPTGGKRFSLNAEEIHALYPAYDSFNQLRQQFDPHGLIRNSFVDRVFAIQ